ncbi:hypothetical protein J6I90_06325 [Pseudidiomarina sp. 1APP75-32.1]|uniref:Sulfotransferase family protein n=1 Tax=Pseudidiomarina terrestris TaxID=2820060 RepID=A0AAW7QWB9_9GAMM|nr:MULTISPECIES: sulfotransferase [unclassified Pseudidiomarina]MDN7124492.1 hypothetical protein [Pseudidiomarina sp. 1APP75-32.1]MDN7129217.1 hypothetical protein [Pseudidiomarina sp. 1APR75-15]
MSIKKIVPYRQRIRLRNLRNAPKVRGKQKIFCIGRNKTGTTSLKKAFQQLGYIVGHQREAERLHHKHYFAGRFDKFVRYCRYAQVFQDVPFSWPETYKVMDQAFPGSKFILTVRDSPEQWYNSITRFHGKLWGKDGAVPTADDLKNATYIFKGAPYNVVKLHGTSDDDPYHRETLINHYKAYNQEIIEYFKDRPEDLLVLNLTEPDAYQKFIDFLGIESDYTAFPWENKT